MRRKLVQPVLPNLFFREEQLAIPGYIFETASTWDDTGSQTLLAVGVDLRDGQNVLAKIAPASGSGAICLEREAHILDQLSGSPEATSIVLRVIELMTLPRESGDCVILLITHPGPNDLGRYFPPSKVNELLLATTPDKHMSHSHDESYVLRRADDESSEDYSTFSIMDLASFLEFAIQSTHCLELVHKHGIIHREVRANAFHLNGHSGLVRFAHFGNRSISLEQLGGPSALVIAADTLEELSKRKVKEALCYLAPEQTGSVETSHEDHRTDLYSLGILFWTLLVGQGQVPFEGSPMEILHAIAQRRPMPVHEFRRDIPHVVAQIIDKLLAKSPDARYNSAYGLKSDLLECQRRLLAAVSSVVSDQSAELIPPFEIAMDDKFIGFTIPNILFGRDRELEAIRSVIRQVASSHARQFGTHRPSFATSGSPRQPSIQMDPTDDRSESAVSSVSESSPPSVVASLTVGSTITADSTARASPVKLNPGREGSPVSISSFNLERRRSRPGRHASRTRVSTRSATRSIVVAGPAGMGKSSLILANQTKWRSHGLWGHAKFQTSVTAPFTAILQCLSSVLRQLMIFQTDMKRFVLTLRSRLGPLLNNAPLLYQGVPEFKDILHMHDVDINTPDLELLSTAELRIRFQTLVEQVFAVLADIRLLALFLDDLHEADESSLDLVQALANSKSRMLILGSVRTEEPSKVERLRQVLGSKSRVTWITLEPMSQASVLTLVSKTLRRSKDDCVFLSRVAYRISHGNAFSVRNFLMSLYRHNQLVFDWQRNYWDFDLKQIESNLVSEQSTTSSDQQIYLASHWRELPSDAQRYLIWASNFGATFKADEVASVIDWEDSSSGSEGETEADEAWRSMPIPSMKELTGRSTTRSSIKGLQAAITEGWLVQRARDMCSFAHDRHRQTAVAMAETLPESTLASMSLRIILMLRHDDRVVDPYRVAEHAKRCLNILKDHSIREEVLGQLCEAGLAAWARGAHELALETLKNAQFLLTEEDWANDYFRAFSLHLKLAELHHWKGDVEASERTLAQTRASTPEDKARCLKLSSNNAFLLNDFAGGLDKTIEALEILGLSVNLNPTKEEMDALFEEVKSSILTIGFERLLELPRADDPRVDLTVQLLTVATLNAYWRHGDGFFEVILLSLTIIKVALSSGMCAGVAMGFFWALGASAEQRDLYNFSKDLGKAGLQIAEMHGTSSDRCRALVLYTSMVSGYDDVHIRENIPRCELALKYGLSSGDRVFAEFALIHGVLNRLFCCEHLGELILEAEDAVNDITSWTPTSDRLTFANGILILVRALGGRSMHSDSAELSAATLFDSDTFNESAYLQHIILTSNNVPLVLGWYNAFKVVGLFSLGFFSEAAELGLTILDSAGYHPNHRFIRYAICYHSLALIACIRKGDLSDSQRECYFNHVSMNQEYLRKWLLPSPVNNSSWVALVEAELTSLNEGLGVNALKLYDTAVMSAHNNDWLFEEGWALFLQGNHLVRSGVEGLGTELQHRGIAKQSQWGAKGVVKYLLSVSGAPNQKARKTSIFSADVGVQTENIIMGFDQTSLTDDLPGDDYRGDDSNHLTASDLSAILRWSTDISSDINLSSALRRLTEIATENSGAQCACVIMARERDYTVATSMVPPAPCVVHENPKQVHTITDPLQRTVIEHCLNTKTRVVFDELSLDSRFASEAQFSPYRAVICLPIFSNRGQTFGAVYLASRYSFLQSTVDILTLFLQQASTSISNALLFRSVQTGTRENLKMISSQRAALEEARRSREEALKAAKIKSNFLASMSHELRTPFSSFYGLLDILASTELNPGQQEIVMTAKTSCELLLKIIDSILDYSKLEASALKLEFSGFPVENIIADCMELLLPMAAKKLDMSFDISQDVPSWVEADYARIRQVLMNLIGNAVKFTASGFVRVVCSIDGPRMGQAQEGYVFLKFTIQDTGIGLSKSDREQLFVPFQQADSSSTRKFGGTGLGLSISRQLVHLMKGAIGVEETEPGVGSLFFFSIPVKIFESDGSKKAADDLERIKQLLLKPRPPRITITSPSETTISLLKTMLNGFFVTSLKTIEEVESSLIGVDSKRAGVDFIIVDNQSESRVDELARTVHAVSDLNTGIKIIHLFTPTTETLSRHQTTIVQAGLVRLTKPPRRLRLLQTLAKLRGIMAEASASHLSDISRALEDVANAQRTLFGRVLIAEDNPVAQQLLKQQLERQQLKVTATSNGDEAVKEWESHGPGYFSIALFDHHMPICDGIEACKRVRLLEGRQKVTTTLPIVALSADCQESTKQLCLSAGMNAFFSKPLKKNDLTMLLSMFGTSSPGGA